MRLWQYYRGGSLSRIPSNPSRRLHALLHEVVAHVLHHHVGICGLARLVVNAHHHACRLLDGYSHWTLLSPDHGAFVALDHYVLAATDEETVLCKGDLVVEALQDLLCFFWADLREVGALGPDIAAVAYDCCMLYLTPVWKLCQEVIPH